MDRRPSVKEEVKSKDPTYPNKEDIMAKKRKTARKTARRGARKSS